MIEDPDKRSLIGNLYPSSGNPVARAAPLKRNAVGAMPSRPLFREGAKPAERFEALMAEEAPQRIVSQVLEGPLSQQAQRQLARLQTMSREGDPREALLGERPAGPEKAVGDAPLSAPRRGPRALSAGGTIVRGVGTGSVFNAAQMAAWRQKHGSFIRLPERKVPETSIASAAENLLEEIQAPAPQKTQAGKDAPGAVPEGERDAALAGGAAGVNVDAIIVRASKALGLDPNLVRAVIKAESNFNPEAVSHAGAKGLMQLMPRTAREMGVINPFDPLENIWGGARYLKRMLDRHGGNINKALAAYNWGPGNLDRHGYGSHMPRETRRYIEVVNRNYRDYKSVSAAA